MGLFRRLLEAVASCLPLWLNGSTPSTPTPSPPNKQTLSSNELQERLKKAAEEQYFCSGSEPLEWNNDDLLECGCEKGKHGPLAINKDGQLFYPV